jgi:hypothetical protein
MLRFLLVFGLRRIAIICAGSYSVFRVNLECIRSPIKPTRSRKASRRERCTSRMGERIGGWRLPLTLLMPRIFFILRSQLTSLRISTQIIPRKVRVYTTACMTVNMKEKSLAQRVSHEIIHSSPRASREGEVNPCCAVLRRPGRYAVCSLEAGHGCAHWDAELRISWNSSVVVEATPMEEDDLPPKPESK